MPSETPGRRGALLRAATFSILVFGVLIGTALLRHPDTPLPPEWNVFEPLRVADPVTSLTRWKLDWAMQDPQICLDVLGGAAQVRTLSPLDGGPNCGIDPRLELRRVGAARLDPVETTCATALRLAMWERHGVQMAARDLLGSDVAVVRHVGSYNCRAISGSTRWSTHARAEAIDITGFDLVDGRQIRLLSDWDGADATADFLRRVRDASCDWFATTLGPDYNARHADHFHLQSRGWGTCR